MSARDNQVAGDYYRNMKIQPFELTISHDLGGVEHTIIKYVIRWRYKGGVEDLRKARHSAEFLVENAAYLIGCRASRKMAPRGINPETYSRENNLPALESIIVHRMCRWQTECDLQALQMACEDMDELIRRNTPEIA